jgi:hypothetical protein
MDSVVEPGVTLVMVSASGVPLGEGEADATPTPDAAPTLAHTRPPTTTAPTTSAEIRLSENLTISRL